MGKKKSVQEAAPVVNVAPQVTTDNEQKPIMYVVVREGFRVSDKEYELPNDPIALAEKEFWTLIATKHSYGEPVSIVQYDAKKHRVW